MLVTASCKPSPPKRAEWRIGAVRAVAILGLLRTWRGGGAEGRVPSFVDDAVRPPLLGQGGYVTMDNADKVLDGLARNALTTFDAALWPLWLHEPAGKRRLATAVRWDHAPDPDKPARVVSLLLFPSSAATGVELATVSQRAGLTTPPGTAVADALALNTLRQHWLAGPDDALMLAMLTTDMDEHAASKGYAFTHMQVRTDPNRSQTDPAGHGQERVLLLGHTPGPGRGASPAGMWASMDAHDGTITAPDGVGDGFLGGLVFTLEAAGRMISAVVDGLVVRLDGGVAHRDPTYEIERDLIRSTRAATSTPTKTHGRRSWRRRNSRGDR